MDVLSPRVSLGRVCLVRASIQLELSLSGFNQGSYSFSAIESLVQHLPEGQTRLPPTRRYCRPSCLSLR